jgi:hypothetical protein
VKRYLRLVGTSDKPFFIAPPVLPKGEELVEKNDREINY